MGPRLDESFRWTRRRWLFAGSAACAAALRVRGAEEALAAVADPRPTLSVSIDGRGPYRLIADSAAEGLALSRGVADELRLPPAAQPTTIVGSTGSAARGARLASRVDSGDLHWHDVRATILDRHALATADGIIGLASLRGLIARYRLSTRSAEVKARDVAKNGIRLPMTLRRGVVPSIDLQWRDHDGGRHEIVALIDTGAQMSVGNDALARLAGAAPSDGYRRTRPLTGSSGETAIGFDAPIQGLRVGAVEWPRHVIAFAALSAFRDAALASVPALLLGVDLLSRFDEISIDSDGRVARALPRQS